MVEAFPKRRPLLPIIHNSKALKLASREEQAQVRCFYALSHRGANPLESDFHMQARLGFRRRNNNNVRLRPIELLPQPEKVLPKVVPNIGSRRISKERDAVRNLPKSHEDSARITPKSTRHPTRASLSSRRNSNSPMGVEGRRRNSKSPMGVEGRTSPMSVVDMEMGGVTWTTFAKVTDETVGTVISGALAEQVSEEAKELSNQAFVKTPFGKKPVMSQDEIIASCALPPQANGPRSEITADEAWKNHAKDKAALVIQSQRRGQKARKSLKDRRVAEEHAAIRLQKLQRGRIARRSLHARKTQELKNASETKTLAKEIVSLAEGESTPEVESSPSRAKAFQQNRASRTTQKQMFVDVLEESPPEPSSSASEHTSVMVEAKDCPLPHWAQKPSVGSWLRYVS